MLTEKELDELIEHLREIDDEIQHFQMMEDGDLVGIRDYGVGEDPGPMGSSVISVEG